jgi:ribosomal protein S18 acetylase RimI-like enzyme
MRHIAVRLFNPSRDVIPLLRLRVSREQEKKDYTSSIAHLLKQARLHPEFDSQLFVILPSTDEQDAPVGVFLLEPLSLPDTTRCVLKGLLIDERFQNNGVGTQLMERLPSIVLEAFPNTRFVHLAVHPDNNHAIHLYRQAGFVPTGGKILIEANGRKDHEYVLVLKEMSPKGS